MADVVDLVDSDSDGGDDQRTAVEGPAVRVHRSIDWGKEDDVTGSQGSEEHVRSVGGEYSATRKRPLFTPLKPEPGLGTYSHQLVYVFNVCICARRHTILALSPCCA
jgi:hypothetical protein